LVTVDDPEHPRSEPEYTTHAGRGAGGPEGDHLGIGGRHVRWEHFEEHEREKCGNDDDINEDVRLTEQWDFGLGHEEERGGRDGTCRYDFGRNDLELARTKEGKVTAY